MRFRRLGLVAGQGLIAAFVIQAGGAAPAQAATIMVGPGDGYAKIEAAGAGDEVVLAPGTYRFRVHLTRQGTAAQPIVIRAQDPALPPVWDLGATLVEDAPGSYTAGDRGRGCWQLSGAAYVHVSGLVITGCHTASANSAGLRYYNGSHGIVLTDILFHDNDNGLTGGSQASDITVEFCEFDHNGSLMASSSAPSHNIYVYGGTFALRYSYVHDPVQAQNFHVRARQSTIEYNWFARARSYVGDLMTDDDNDGPETQTMLLRGNVIVQGDDQANTSQIVAVYNDGAAPGLTLNVKLVYNTVIGAGGGKAALVHLSNADGTTMNAQLDDNIIWHTTRVALVDDPAHGHVSGTNNWLQAGADATGLAASVLGADPGFSDAAGSDFTLATGSAAIGAASTAAGDLPDREYYRDETTARRYRARATARDLGAFESTTVAAPVGPYGAPASGGGGGAAGGGPGNGGGGGQGGAGARMGSGGVAIGGAGGPSASGGAGGGAGPAPPASGGPAPPPADGGCSCVVGPGAPGPLTILALACAIGRSLRRRVRAPSARRPGKDG